MNYVYSQRRTAISLLSLFAVLALVFGYTTIVFGQTETGTLTGSVKDPSGAVVPGADVTATNIGTSGTRKTTADNVGNYTITNLIPAVYKVTVEAKGFGKAEKRVEITVGSKVALDFTLSLGQATTIVEVSAEAGVEVNTETQTLSSVISGTQVTELPTLTRNPYDLVFTSGNITGTAGAGLSTRGGGFQANGVRAAANNVLLDGAANNDEFAAVIGQQVPLDSVQEFSVITNNFTAEYGRAAGGIVNVATKAGTNSFHGTAYEFGRYSHLASNTFDNNASMLKKPVFTRNQFGYSVGGPVFKDKLFFFQSTEWTRIRSSAQTTVNVPDAALLAAANANTQAFFAGKALRSGLTPLRTYRLNQLAGLGITCPAGGTCAALTAANPTLNAFDRVAYNVPSDSGGGTPQNTYNLVGRVDYNLSSATQLYARYALYKEVDFTGSNVNSAYAGFDTGASQTNNNFLFSMTHQFTPRLTYQAKVTYNRFNNLQPLGSQPVQPTLYMFSSTVSINGDNINFPGYTPFSPGNAIPFGGPQNFIQTYHDISYTKGRHTLRFGGNYTYIQDNRAFGAYEEAVETLSSTDSGTALENFLNGNIDTFQAAVNPNGSFPCKYPAANANLYTAANAVAGPNPNAGQCVNSNTVTFAAPGHPTNAGRLDKTGNIALPVGPPDFTRSNRYHEFGLYFQDSWKALSRLTLNLGIRYEYFGVQHNKNPFKDSNFYDGTNGGTVQANIRAGSLAIAPLSAAGGLWRPDYNNFAPRLGFAYDVFGNGKTSLRGGYGIGYERDFGNVTFNVIQNPPAYAVIALQSGFDVPGFLPVTTSNAGPLAGTTPPAKALPAVSGRNVDSNIRTAYDHFWSLSVEHEALKNLFMGVDYSGSKGVDLYSIANINRVGGGNVYLGDPTTTFTRITNNPAIPGTANGYSPFTSINRRGDIGASQYNALNVRVDVRNIGNSGVTLRSAYTWSHGFDDLSSTFSESGNNRNLGFLDPFNPHLDYGNADFDVRNRWVMSAVWNVPFWRHSTGWVKYVADGWEFAPIVTVRSGTPFTLYDTTNASLRQDSPRVFINGPRPPHGGTSSVKDPNAANTNVFFWNSISGAILDESYRNAITNSSDFGPYPGNMLPRNYFRAAGYWNFDIGIYKTTKLTERFSLQFRGEFFDAFNHSNLYVQTNVDNVRGATAAVPFQIIAKKGVTLVGPNENRNIQLALKLIF